MSNNVNQQNFSSEDLLGVAEASDGRGGRGATRNFRVGGQSGISAVNSAGLNFINNWDDIWKVNASYFFNMSDNTDRKSTRLNSSHVAISYAVFCLKQKQP